MIADDIILVVAEAIGSDVAHAVGAMRHLRSTEDDVARTVLNAPEEAGFEIVGRARCPTA